MEGVLPVHAPASTTNVILFSLLTKWKMCDKIPRNKEEVTASHLKRNAAGVNNAVPEKYRDLFECGENLFHRIFVL